MPTAKVAGADVSTAHFIDGKRVESKRTFEVCSPINGKHLADVSAGGSAEIDQAVAAARRAFPKWAALGAEGRAPILSRFAKAILDHAAELAAVETEDNGSLLIGNVARMVPRAAHNIQFFADRALKLNDEKIDSPEVVNHVRFDPAGVAALITPWNGPFMLTTWKVGPCLAAGNTAVVKPPEWAPLTCSMMCDLAAEAGLPPGVLNIVQGIGEEAGAALAAHPDVDRLSFTGSTDTAKLIGASTARSLTPVSFELGGKSPFIVCADADLDSAAQTAAGQYFNAGQGLSCRYAHPGRYENRRRVFIEVPHGSIADDGWRSAREDYSRRPADHSRALQTGRGFRRARAQDGRQASMGRASR